MRKKKRSNALYVHVPFCQHLCHYCDFTKLLYDEKKAELYVDQLIAEIHGYGITPVATIYIGGGTPTALSLTQLEKLLNAVAPLLEPGAEFTVEANIENATREKLLLLQKYGVNRLSLGVESMHDEILASMNRHHTAKEAVETVRLAQILGFKNINVDLIYGLPETDLSIIREDLNKMLALNVDHISTYALLVAPHTVFFAHHVAEPTQEVAREQYDLILTTLRRAGYERYEVSNFARNGKQSKHNLVYWNDEEYYGVGLGASGYLDGVRYTNTKNLTKYLAGNYIDQKETITPLIEEENFLMLKLRLAHGFTKADYRERFDTEFNAKYKEEVERLVKKGLLIDEPERVRCTDDGIMLLDYVLLHLYKE